MVRDGCAQRVLDGCAEVRMRRSMDWRARRCREVATCGPARYAKPAGHADLPDTPGVMGECRLPPRHAACCGPVAGASCRLPPRHAGCWRAGWRRVGRAAHMPGHRRMSCDSTRALPLRHRHAYSRHRPTVLSSSLGQRAPAVRHAPVLMHLFVIGRTAPSVKSFSTDSRVDVGLHSIRLAEVTRGREGLPVRWGRVGSYGAWRAACPGVPCIPLRVSASPLIPSVQDGVMRASPGCKGRPVAREWGDRPGAQGGECGDRPSTQVGQVRRSVEYEGWRARRAVTFPSESMTFASFLIRDICFFCEHRPGLDPAQASPADPCRTRAWAGVPRMCPGIRRVTA